MFIYFHKAVTTFQEIMFFTYPNYIFNIEYYQISTVYFNLKYSFNSMQLNYSKISNSQILILKFSSFIQQLYTIEYLGL